MFVHGGVLVAISQSVPWGRETFAAGFAEQRVCVCRYNHYCCYGFTQEQVEGFRGVLVRKFREVSPLLAAAGYQDYVIDMGVIQALPEEQQQAVVIELNPYGAKASVLR